MNTIKFLIGIRFTAAYLAFILGVPARMLYNKLKTPEKHFGIYAVLFPVIFTVICLTHSDMNADLAAGNVTSATLFILRHRRFCMLYVPCHAS